MRYENEWLFKTKSTRLREREQLFKAVQQLKDEKEELYSWAQDAEQRVKVAELQRDQAEAARQQLEGILHSVLSAYTQAPEGLKDGLLLSMDLHACTCNRSMQCGSPSSCTVVDV